MTTSMTLNIHFLSLVKQFQMEEKNLDLRKKLGDDDGGGRA